MTWVWLGLRDSTSSGVTRAGTMQMLHSGNLVLSKEDT